MIYIRNFEDSIVARAADIDIGTSCVMMRASRSILGCLETTSGALALYRADLLYDHLEAYAVECGTGDDRWLALRALERGQVVGVAEALVETDMPTTLKGTYRQRLRWARSWWWMLPYVFKNLSPRQLISPTYGMLQLVISPAITMWALYGTVAGAIAGHARYTGTKGMLALGVYMGAYVVVRWGLSGLYLVGRPGMPAGQKWRSFLVGTPAAILLNLFLLTPTRYVALFKLFDNRWQTRTSKATPVNHHVSRHDPDQTPTLVMPVLRDADGRPVDLAVPRQTALAEHEQVTTRLRLPSVAMQPRRRERAVNFTWSVPPE
jgi:hyaluronan synthase